MKTDEVIQIETPAPVTPTLKDEIEAGVEIAVKESDQAREAAKPAAEKKDVKPAKAQAGEESGGESPDAEKKPSEKPAEEPEAKPGEITDVHVERAVKAGLTIADAKSFKDPAALERVCSMLETKGGTAEKPVASPEPEEEDPTAGIPDLNADDYDEQIVSGFKAMKDLIRDQHKTITALKGAGGQSWLDGQIAALGGGFKEALGADKTTLDPASPQAAKRAELDEKVKVLTAGYKAAGKEVTRDTIFKEAVSMVLPGVTEKASDDAKKETLAKREQTHISRPAGGRSAPSGDPLKDVADAIDKRFKK